jgi:HTH-type transcriptional regulator / antitoxin HipB
MSEKMSTLDAFIEEEKHRDHAFAEEFDEGYERFKLGVLLQLAREDAGLSKQALATSMQTNAAAITRIEQHAEKVSLSALQRYAMALGKRVRIGLH